MARGLGPPDAILTSQWLPVFREFVKLVSVSSKEMPAPGQIQLYRAQHIALDAIASGLEEGIHDFTFLKARQLGLSTLFIILDIFWLYMFPGLQGAFVSQDEPTRENFRQQITAMLASLPISFKIPVVKHDRTLLMLQNGSVLQYLSAGKGRNSNLGRSRALNFLHATEISSWGDPKGYDTLRDTLAIDNPNRLYLWESTALGFNLFYDCWTDAKNDDLTKKACFIGWWAKDIYRFEQGTRDYQKWWEGFPEYTEYEARTTLLVYQRYGWEISPEQWAWYRWKGDNRSEHSLMEEFPSTEEESFQATGSPFFNQKRVSDNVHFLTATLNSGQLVPEHFTYMFGEKFTSMKIRRSNGVEETDLLVWEGPVEGARYVIGVDPAYGSSDEADRTVISVWRCFSDKLVQVAEYCNPLTTTHNCAWALAHLAGEYGDCIINLELQGGGGEVKMELEYLKKSVKYGPLQREARALKIEDALDSARWFLFRKEDSLSGTPSVTNWKTSASTKSLGLNRFQDAYASGQLVVRSLPLLDEMTTLKRDGDKIAASGRNKDDRVMASMLAVYAWKEWVQPGMMALNRTYDREMAEQLAKTPTQQGLLPQIIPTFLREQAARREGISFDRILDDPL